MSNVSQWSTAAGSNNSAVPDGFPENMAPSGLNDAAREVMAAVAKVSKDQDGTIVTAGTGTAYTLTTNNAHAALADVGLTVFRIHTANTGSATLAMDGLTAKTMKLAGADLASGDLPQDSLVIAAYNSTNDVYDVFVSSANTVTTSGTQTLTNKTLTSPDIDGGTADNMVIGGSTPGPGNFTSVTVTGTVDGRDVATDGTKLDGVETGATQDQTGAEIKSAYESESNTNAFTDAEQTKLSGIATGAEVNPDVVSQVDAEAGTATDERIWTAQRVAQAIAALAPSGGAAAGSYSIDTFTSSGTSTRPTGADSCWYLCVAGGGGGGGVDTIGDVGGGGGGGEVKWGFESGISSNLTATIGSGGAGGTAGNAGSEGGDSSITGTGFTSVTSQGGGGGAANVGGDAPSHGGHLGGQGTSGAAGGGGGAGAGGPGGDSLYTKATQPNTGYNRGGSTATAFSSNGGGAGGAGMLGYGGGGGGGSRGNLSNSVNFGTAGGGDGGNTASGPGGDATANTGSGGGGSYGVDTNEPGGDGADGYVIIAWLDGS